MFGNPTTCLNCGFAPSFFLVCCPLFLSYFCLQGDTVAVESVKVGLRGVHLLLQEMHGHLKRGLAPKNSNPAFARLREVYEEGVELSRHGHVKRG